MSTRRFATTSIVILSVGLLTVCGAALAGELFTIDWHTIDGGGFQLTGGFWFEQPPGDCNATGIADLLDHADFADCLTGPGGGLPMPDCNCFDVDGDNDGDLFDAAELQVAFSPT